MVYKKGPRFRIRKISDIQQDMLEARRIHGNQIRTLFFPAGNTIAMKTEDLCDLCIFARETFSALERITVYGSSPFEVSSCVTSDHYTNYISVQGKMPQQQSEMLAQIQAALTRREDTFRPFFVGTA
jgi:hypothetical protein